MNILNLIDFFSYYSLPTVIISAFIAAICFLIDRLFAKKLSVSLRSYLPFIAGIILYAAYYAIFVSGYITVDENVIYGGILCGSISTILYVMAVKIVNGVSLSSLKATAIEGAISLIIKESCLSSTVKAAEKLFNSALTDEDLLTALFNLFKENALEETTDDLISNAVNTAVTGVNAVTNAN